MKHQGYNRNEISKFLQGAKTGFENRKPGKVRKWFRTITRNPEKSKPVLDTKPGPRKTQNQV